MDAVLQKTNELGQALLQSEVYLNMKAAEEKALKNEEAARLMGEVMQRRTQIQEEMKGGNPDPKEIIRLSDEADDLEVRMQQIDDIAELTQARAAFDAQIAQINQLLQFIVTGRMDDGCSGNCSSCGGCH